MKQNAKLTIKCLVQRKSKEEKMSTTLSQWSVILVPRYMKASFKQMCWCILGQENIPFGEHRIQPSPSSYQGNSLMKQSWMDISLFMSYKRMRFKYQLSKCEFNCSSFSNLAIVNSEFFMFWCTPRLAIRDPACNIFNCCSAEHIFCSSYCCFVNYLGVTLVPDIQKRFFFYSSKTKNKNWISLIQRCISQILQYEYLRYCNLYFLIFWTQFSALVKLIEP